MRGMFRDQGGLFSYVSPESRVPPGHPLRKIRGLVRDVLAELSRSFARLYAREGRPSVPPEQLLSGSNNRGADISVATLYPGDLGNFALLGIEPPTNLDARGVTRRFADIGPPCRPPAKAA